MNAHPLRWFLPLPLLLAACGGGSIESTSTGPKFPPRPESCEFEVYTASPGRDVTEIGTIDITPNVYSGTVYKDVAALKEAIRPYVCRTGGDAALAFSNGYGMYIKVTILKRGTSELESNIASPPASAAGGCSYDTQCKGDRVCVHGACVEPAPKTAR